ncbi:trifunctional purine biosynthetic protein adenosine-3 [Ischnura elegans]|uniref:trifunctional purine biosynthetic protein adenosine-3 n=1 Tax=Ischnura elegans TaxID=197161 RepID=UPI001ED870A4|nr:trifunctional purine biosynthetic protein adenosine-3 [Ischnura elegans]
MAANVLVIGSGGREHALCWKLAQSVKVKQVYVAPGNVGITSMGKVEKVDLDLKNFKAVGEWCKKNNIDLVVIGPEDPLANGMVDVLAEYGLNCFGPKKAAAQIEADKNWSKAFMDRHNIPTARWKSFQSAAEAKKFIMSAPYPALVVKASGLAAGKGVVVAGSKEEACEAVDSIATEKKYGSAGETVVVEELLQGEEVSVLAFVSGGTVKVMLPAQDHKRLKDNDQGPNTGGMGAYCPCPIISEEELEQVRMEVLQRAADGLVKEKIPFTGVLYAGMMLTRDGPKTLEFNCRFGDPETQVILPLLESDLYQVMLDCSKGNLEGHNLKWKEGVYAVGVVMASKGYPETSTKGNVIKGLDEVSLLPNHIVFHSGTAFKSIGDGSSAFVTNGGRVLIAIALAADLALAAARAHAASCLITFDGAQFRGDIAHKSIARAILERGKLTYKASGVDIVAGDTLVNRIKPAIKLTHRTGTVGTIGGFGGLFDVKAAGFKDPLLVSGTDGVGTKLKIAQSIGKHNTIGIDLVAMCVNDILAHGAEPLFFLDYFACGMLNVDVAAEVVSGIAEGCRMSGCALIGGETAEMPGIYQGDDYDLAGFAVGAVEKDKVLPLTSQICEGDVIIGIASSGVHSNGFSLVRKILEKARMSYTDAAPFGGGGMTVGEALLVPTKLYVKSVLPALRKGLVKAFAHITGGGLTENVPRVLPSDLAVTLDAKCWEILPVFGWLAAVGGVSQYEMLRTFNCGIGAVLVVSQENKETVLKMIDDKCSIIGKVVKRNKADHQVVVQNFVPAMDAIMRPHVPFTVSNQIVHKMRVGVLISGSGTNLQALIDHTTNPSKSSAAEIVLVISNKANVEGLKRAERAGIPTLTIPHVDYKTRGEFELALTAALESAHVELVCLAGFMRVLTGVFVKRWRGNLINIHPALLPLFKGTHAHRQALEAGVRVTGCSVHYVEEDVDAGAILVQEVAPIMVGDTEEILQERVKLVEHVAYPKALEQIAQRKVSLDQDGRLLWK